MAVALCWSTSLKTAPQSEPLTLTEARLHLRIPDAVTDEDDLIEGLIIASREYTETYTNRALITQTWYWKADGFPCAYEPILLPRPPLVSITSISYVDTNGTTQTWAAGSSGYQLVKPAGPKAQYATIWPSYQQIYPVTRDQPEAVTIEYICGYGDALSVPQSIKEAQKRVIGYLYDCDRDGVVPDLSDSSQALAVVHWLLGGYTVERF